MKTGDKEAWNAVGIPDSKLIMRKAAVASSLIVSKY